jgi:nucleoside-diphosphate-sugar epimerase
MKGIIGNTGFIGKNLMTHMGSDFVLINSSNINDINFTKLKFNKIYIAAPSSSRWEINLDARNDSKNYLDIANFLKRNIVGKVIVMSTCDVFGKIHLQPKFENSNYDPDDFYSENRVNFEIFIRNNFSHLIARLPIVYGNGMKKNIIFDIKNNRIDQINTYCPKNILQFINVNKIYSFLTESEKSNLQIINIPSEQIQITEILDIFKVKNDTMLSCKPNIIYNMRSNHQEIVELQFDKGQLIYDLKRCI